MCKERMLAFVLNESVSFFLFLSVSKCPIVRFHFLLYIDHYLIHTYYTVNKRWEAVTGDS